VGRARGSLVRTSYASVVLACVLGFTLTGIVVAAPAQALVDHCSTGLIALTFDDGPSPTQTPRLLKILEKHRVPATFFMVGSRVTGAPGVARKVAAAGFEIGNHTWSHPMLTRLTDHQIRKQLRDTTREFRADRLPVSPLMRPPYGAIDPRVRTVIRDLSLTPVLWNVDSRDWAGGDSRQIANRILAQLRPHQSNIVLQHDGVENSPASVGAVPLVIHDARARGYCFTKLNSAGRMAAKHHRARAARAAVQAAPVPRPLLKPIAATTLRVFGFDPWYPLRAS
jgi:peptidoglycan/xylan/chitin deacetylase (PgdA/CDA1 family)